MKLATLQLGGRRDGPHVLLTGGVHGDEFEPMAALRRLAVLLAPHEIKGRITIVPVVNESAFRLGQRVGDDELDLARTCPGRPDGSATEQVAHALADLIRDADAYIDLHTGGARLSVLPLTGYMLHPEPAVLDRQRRMARAFGLPIVWGTDPSLNGRSLSVARDANVPAIYAEYLGGGGCDPSGVSSYVQGCLNVLAELKLIDGKLAHPSDTPLVIEDQRTGSGHMQVQHPAPCDGLFEAAVTLGQAVRQGEILGTISDVLGADVRPIKADWTGLVLVLRCFARVSAGESVGVVLETDQRLPSQGSAARAAIPAG
ncbi:succinylglutamate desuccinylase/aspartoacylase family protein [Singulisphaera sp. Ch08]|uniref:Succinylglutamate desuccinylase/aspartoacylase family protein n=1 Tax=Singulisphaera sp. Ch08 TaxID=3120278 RepID=A0AAU7CJ02_9BACT